MITTSTDDTSTVVPSRDRGTAPIESPSWRIPIIAGSLLLVLFSKVLFDLFLYGLNTKVYSHILLVPGISFYFVWQLKGSLPNPRQEKSLLGFLFAGLSVLTLGTYFGLRMNGWTFSQNDYLFFGSLAFSFATVATALFVLGLNFVRRITFALAFLFFIIPFPDKVTTALEIASQHASAEVYSWMMDLTQATYFQQGLVFALPGLTIEVAQECSGIRSSLVLFITSLIAAQMFLKTGWKKWVLALAVFPLGIMRNAFRIYVISMLSAHWNPQVIHSPLHHHGGPIFFVLSLIPFFALLLFLRRTDVGR